MKSFGGQNLKRFMCSLVRQNFAKECEDAINKQINMELQACHNYLAMVILNNKMGLSINCTENY